METYCDRASGAARQEQKQKQPIETSTSARATAAKIINYLFHFVSPARNKRPRRGPETMGTPRRQGAWTSLSSARRRPVVGKVRAAAILVSALMMMIPDGRKLLLKAHLVGCAGACRAAAHATQSRALSSPSELGPAAPVSWRQLCVSLN